jgi:hypothetical protein
VLERVAAPEAGLPVLVHGVGACLPEAVPGDLVTPRPHRIAPAVEAVGPDPQQLRRLLT